MRLFKIEVSHLYTWDSDSEETKAKKARQLEERIHLFEQLKITPDRKKAEGFGYGYPGELLVNDQQLLALTIGNQEPKIKSEVPVPEEEDGSPELPAVMRKFNRLAQKLISLPGLNQQQENYFNQKCEVHIPGPALTNYNDLLLAEDICTDELQRHLNNGWRIIAACPQPSQRRPDYILGRYNPDIVVENKYNAERR